MKHLQLYQEFINESQNPDPVIKKFCKDTSITFDQYTGKTQIDGDLCITGTSIPHWSNTPIDWSTVELTSPPPGFSPRIKGYLYLYGFTSLPDGFSPEVDKHLVIDGTPLLPSGFSPKVAEHLTLDGITELPANPEWVKNIQGEVFIKQAGKRRVLLSQLVNKPIKWKTIK